MYPTLEREVLDEVLCSEEMILVFTIFYKLFYDFKRQIRSFYTILIILNPNFSKKGQNSAFRFVQRKTFTNLIYIDSKVYNVNVILCAPAALQMIHPGNKIVSRKNL